ncbi:glycosyltransferase family 2 protein [Flavobacteriaceae bacterium TK19130]|nr:glycosyltransferase family 2 protein [Thermobacterium salinum]
MRKGVNPEKDKKLDSYGYHRIIVPIYVPNLEGYFEHGLAVTKLCISSLLATKHEKSLLTIVNNGSCMEVSDFLQQLYKTGKIDQLVHYKNNVGKIDAMIPIARTSQEPLITLSDGDVLFTSEWMQAVEEIFLNIPKAGMVAPVPNPTLYRAHTENTLFDGFFSRSLKFQSVCSEEDLLRFAESVGSEESMYRKKSRLHSQLTIEKNGVTAVVGCGHFVATLRKEVFEKAPKTGSQWAYAAAADRDYIDLPNDRAGFWRLATPKSYAFHIGNQIEPWMHKVASNNDDGIVASSQQIPPPKRSSIGYGVKKAINRLWLNQYTRPFFFKRMGLKRGYDEY